MTNDAVRNPLDDVTGLGNWLNHVSSIVAPTGPWGAAEPSRVVSALADALIGMLGLTFVHVRVSDPAGGPSIEVMRVADSIGETAGAPGIRERAAVIVGDVDLSVATARLGRGGEIGILVAGSHKADFPAPTERLLLDVAASQATIVLQQTYLGRQLVHTIPGLVAILTPAGEVDYVNDELVDYCGQPLEAMKQWGSNGTVHTDDLPRVGQVFAQAIASGNPYDFEARIRHFDGLYRWCQVRGLPFREASGRIVRWYVLLSDIDDRKRVEHALREGERELRLIVDSIPGFIAAFTPAGELEFVNRPIVEYFGKTFEELKGWGTDDTVHPEDHPRAVEVFARSIASGDSFEIELRARRFDGVYRWFQSRGLPLRDSNGHIVRWYNLLIDIDERKRTEQELRGSEARKAAILDSALDCIVTIDHDGCITEFNPSAERTFGHRREEVVGRQLSEVIIPPALRERHRQGFARYLATSEARVLGKRIEMTAVRADGSEFPTELAITRIPLDGPPSFTGYLRDITERKRAEEGLRRSEAFLAEGQRLARIGNFVWHLGTGDISWSEQVYRMFEFEPGTRVTLELIGSRVHPDDLPMLYDMVERAQRGESYFEYEHRLVMPDHSVKHLHLIAHAVRAERGGLEYIGAVQDVTKRKLGEEALDKARSELAHVARAAALSTVTASIAHEINQPLSGIITNAGTCLRMLDGAPPNIDGARETARRTIRDGNRASDVISRLRALFSKRDFALEPLDLTEATREVIALSSNDLQRNRIVLQPDLADDLPIVNGDRIQLQQVILNLLRNASEAMADVHDRPRQLLIRTEREDDSRVRLSVRDTGIGLPLQSLESLFDAFRTTKAGGMGIGLFVSRSIVERHQGRLWAEPNDGPGATFAFSIPCQAT